jgi:hypothetical protein
MGNNRALSRVGEAAIAARMSDAEVLADPAKAMTIAMDAMRATLGLSKPIDTALKGNEG